jgi:hypothetical protein
MITKNVNGETISQAFIDEIRSDSPNVITKLMLNGSEIACDIMNLQVTKGSCGSTELSIGNVIADMLTASVKNLEDSVKGEDIECYIGAWTGEDYEFISLGVFTVTEAKKTRYTTEITAYSGVVGKTAKYYVGDNSNPSIAELGQNIATILGCDITFDPAIDTTQIVMASVLESTLYQCLQAVAICSGGYVINDNAGNIVVKKFNATPTLDVDTGMMLNLPQVDEAPVEVSSVRVNGEYPYSGQIGFLADEQNRNIADEQDRLFYGFDTTDNADVEFDCDYMTNEVFNANIVDIIGYTYWHATVGLTLGDPRLEGCDVLAVTDVDGTIYNVPCHQITHSYSGGFKSDIQSAQPTQRQNDIGSVSPLGATQELAFQAYMGNKRTGQFLWFVGDGDDAGLHITSEPKDDFLDTPDGGNLLARSDGLIMRDGLTEKAKFGVGEVTVGETDSSHVSITSEGMKLYGEDGENAGATIANGQVIVGGEYNEGGSISVLDGDNTQVVQLNNGGVIATKGRIADFYIDDTGLESQQSDYPTDPPSVTRLEPNRLTFSIDEGNGYAFDNWVTRTEAGFRNTHPRRDPIVGKLRLEPGEQYPIFSLGLTRGGLTFAKIELNPRTSTVEISPALKVSGTLSVTGTKQRAVKTPNYNDRSLYCYETPTPLFGDIGEAMLDESGVGYVDLDDIFAETITTKMEYQVFLQKEGDGDCYVAEKCERYFVIKGTPNLKVAWELKAKQRDYEHIRLEEPNEYEEYAEVNATDDIYEYIEEQESLLYG